MAVGTPGALPQPAESSGVLGQGVAYPLAYDSKGRLTLSQGVRSVLDAVRSIGLTQPGERPMEPDYGASMGVFEPVTDSNRLIARLVLQVRDHEPRVKDIQVNASLGETGNGLVESVAVTVIGEANPRTLTFPEFIGP